MGLVEDSSLDLQACLRSDLRFMCRKLLCSITWQEKQGLGVNCRCLIKCVIMPRHHAEELPNWTLVQLPTHKPSSKASVQRYHAVAYMSLMTSVARWILASEEVLPT